MEKRAKQNSLLAHDDARRALYRGDDKVFAGVCSGIAERMDADAILVRVTVVVLVFCTFGLAIVPYAAMAAFLPSHKEAQGPVDVDAVSVRSDRYQRVIAARESSSFAQRSYGVRADAGHIPPAPPEGEVAPSRTACSYAMGAIEFDQERVARRLPIVLAITVLITGLFVFFINYGVAFIPGVTAVGFWPMLFVVVGTTLLVCFADKLSLRVRLCGLIACIEVCLAVLPFSLGICPLQSLARISDATAVLWLVVAACVAVALIFDRSDFLALGIGLAALALAISYFDMGIVDRLTMFSSYARHNMTLPLFRG